MTYELEDKLTNDVYAETGGDIPTIRRTVRYLIRHWWVQQPEGPRPKLADLAEQISEDTESYNPAVKRTLRWLDEHPEAVPSPSPAKPTITESEIAKAFGPEYVAWARMCLARIGIAVIPDPVPTNAELLAEVLIDLGHPEPHDYARRLDDAGVTAPGSEE